MPIHPSAFRPPLWLKNPHVQTVVSAFVPGGRRPDFRRERVELPDGDFFDVDWLESGAGRCVVLCHGLESSATDGLLRRTAALFASARWDVLAWNYRGCGGEPNRLARSYYAADPGDFDVVFARARAAGRRVALVGFSLGGNLALKMAARPDVANHLVGSVGISAPVALAACANRIDTDPANTFYRDRFVRRMRRKLVAKAVQFPGEIDAARLESARTIGELDEYFTAPLHGFRNADHYWTECSARRDLEKVPRPVLLLNAVDDPFLAPECFPTRAADANPQFTLEMPDHGGHLGFVRNPLDRFHYPELRALEFLTRADRAFTGWV